MKGFGFYFKIVDRIAICSVYMACESLLNNDYKTWNDMIYAELDRELEVLENDGYKCVIVGDLNAHVGLPPQGIEGNRAGVNYNGKKLLNFIERNNLLMVKKDKIYVRVRSHELHPTQAQFLIIYLSGNQ